MRRTLSSLALGAFLAVPFTLVACGDDEDTPGGSGGSKAQAGNGSGADGGTGDGNGGKTGTGGKSGTGGTTPSVGGDGGTPGTPPEGGSGGTESPAAGSGGGGSGPGPVDTCDLSGEGKAREELSGDIEEDMELDSDIVYEIKGEVKVRPGITVTIPACTRLEGFPSPETGVFTVMRGARLVAEGTADAPILFTSYFNESAVDPTEPRTQQRNPGDWGGVLVLGQAPITREGGIREAEYEAFAGDDDYRYGGADADDDSGVLKYVRIEYAGWAKLTDKEVNGLTLAGVGNGTTIDHVMVTNAKDDCFEWFGGTVEANYLIANNCGDDDFDGDEGWRGGGRYWFSRRDPAFVDSENPHGLEMDGLKDGAQPVTAFTFENVTLCGTGESSGRTEPHFGMLLKELVTGEINNLALTGFEYGVDTREAFKIEDVAVENSQYWGLLEATGAPDATDNDSGFDDGSVLEDGDGNEEPDPAPFTIEQCLDDDGPAAAVINSEIGAFPNATAVSAWKLTSKWVDWSEKSPE